MKIIYANKSSGINEQGSFQNPDYYEKPNTNAKSVVIYGDYPEIKADYEKLTIGVEVRELTKAKPLTLDVKVGITPELQASIDQAKAECEKVVAENAELKGQLDKERQAATKLMSENSELKDKLLIAEKALVAADEEIKALKAAAKKPTAAELKAIKAAEEAAKAEQLKD
ncbi:HeH/LEM domain protein [Acinetobacter sp. RF15A]|uniref:HeH/LEM domain protein n=1 Tax=unclassified Acinetobacter TaxID=196816 RepID=UPI0011917347|nr:MULTISPECIES: HeH/LEM domain protein [unclassified Acinetobacter]TSH74895.1 HeH/LEM domain protein [Acinetobacter sp. RF15A]TSI20408.1 HeH/LEM domain protein [Acinetobacter sp. RF15B]